MSTTEAIQQNPSFVLRAVKEVAFEDRPIPDLTDKYDVRIRVEQTGICGSDVHYWQRGRIGDFTLTSPIILGHESAGTIDAVGSAVKDIKVGQRVAIEPGVPCRRCDRCREGAYNLCEDTIFAATPPWDGTLAKYYICASDYVYPIPDHMTMEEGAMVEPTAVACQVLKVAEMKAGQTVLVFGCGPIGILCQAVAKAYGAKKVVGIDVVQSRLDFAKTFGTDEVFLPERCPPDVEPTTHSERMAAAINKQCGLGEGADIVLECTGAEPCIQMGINAARKGGTYVQTGMGKENVVMPITTMCIRALNVRGSIRYTAGCYPMAVDLVASGKVDVKRLITQRFEFTEAEKAFDLVKAGRSDVMKVVIQGVK